mmetsp:Transcript_21092/g.43115  ORF Transcript_21092/g.43115 Transcript_21092/m.43115 type:complete len:116 (+) Transcript_21092:5324-5671(+)
MVPSLSLLTARVIICVAFKSSKENHVQVKTNRLANDHNEILCMVRGIHDFGGRAEGGFFLFFLVGGVGRCFARNTAHVILICDKQIGCGATANDQRSLARAGARLILRMTPVFSL